MHKKLIAIVPAAGIGARALEADSAPQSMPKQYRLLKGEPMLRWAVRALLADERIAQVRVAVVAHDTWVEQALAGLPRTLWRPCGGPSRALTVLAALQDAGLEAGDWVLVHDAARPGLPADALQSNSVFASFSMLTASDMVTIASQRSIAQYERMGALKRLPIRFSAAPPVMMYWRRDASRSAAMDMALQCLRELEAA